MKKLLVICFAALLVVAFTVPAMAATKSVTFYGNVRMWTGILKNSKEVTGTYADKDTQWDMDIYNSRFGAKFKAGDISANVELRPWSASYYRQFWAAWNFGSGTILIGHAWSPLFLAGVVGNTSDRGGNAGSYGDMWGSLRQPMIKLTVPFSMGTFVLALEKPNVSSNIVGGTDQDTSLPRIETRVAFKLGPANVNVFYGYNKYNDVDTTDKAYGISSYIYGARGNLSVGPASLAVVAWKGQNTANYGLVGNALSYAGATFQNSEVVDATVDGYFTELGYKVNDMLTLQAGYGYTKADRYLQEEDTQSMIYARAPIQVAKGFTISPEIGKYDNKESISSTGTKTDKGETTYYGVYWRINF